MKVLAVDDVLLIRKLIGRVVGALGGELLEASDGVEALLTLEKTGGNIDLILLDLNMPKMDGFEFLKRIKSKEKFRHIPVIIATTEAEKDKIVRAIQAGVNNYLVKPFSEHELTKKILECQGLGYEYDIFNKCFSEAVNAVITSATGLEATESYGAAEEKAGKKGYFTGQIVVLGQVNALAFLNVDRAAALRIVSTTTGTPVGDISLDQLYNGMAGIIYKVTARVKTMLAGMNLPWSVSFPFVSVGLAEGQRHITPLNAFIISKKFSSGDIEATLKIYFL